MQVIEKMETGGAQRLLADMLRVMAQMPGVELTLAVYQSLPDSVFERQVREMPGVRFVALGVGKTDHLAAISRLRPLIKETDVCHVHLFPALYHCALASIGSGTRMVYTEHSTYNRRRNRRWLRPIERFIYGRYDVIACISNAVRINLATWLDSERISSRLRVVTNGVDLSRFSNVRPDSSIREMFGREGTPVLMVSRFVESKDQPTLIRAIHSIPEKDIFAAFIGDGPNRKECERLAEELGVSERIVFLGEREDIDRYIAASEVGVQSSKWEGFGLTVVEMMAGGLPVIVSDVSGMADLVKDVGMTFPRGDFEALAERIKECVGIKGGGKSGGGISSKDSSKSQALREKLRSAEILRASHYDIAFTAQNYLDCYSRK